MELGFPDNKLLAGNHAPFLGSSAVYAAAADLPDPAPASAPVVPQRGNVIASSFNTGERGAFLILDNNIHISNKSNGDLSNNYDLKIRKKRGAAKHCLLSGFDNWVSRGYGNNFYWLTLSSPVGARRIQKSWNQFLYEVRRLTDRKLKKLGFIKRLGKTPDQKYLFECFVCFTSEGNGVAHVVFVGNKLPVKWIRQTWNRIHGLTANYKGNVQFRLEWIKPSQTDHEKLTKYVMTQYVTNQNLYIRHSKSQNWIYKGYRKDWLNICRKLDYDWSKIYPEWHTRMATHSKDMPLLPSIVKPRHTILLASGIEVEVPSVYGVKFEFPHQKEARIERLREREIKKYEHT